MATEQVATTSGGDPRWRLSTVLRLAGRLVVLLAAGWLIFAIVGARSLPALLGTAGFMVLVLAGALLNLRFPWLGQLANRVFVAYMTLLVWLMIGFAPVVAFHWLFDTVTWRLALWAQVPAFVALGALLAVALWLMATKARRRLLFTRLRGAGALLPLIYVGNALILAAMFFASVTFVLVRHGAVQLGITAGDDVLFGKLLDFYVWHFLDLVPLVKVNATLHWQEPLVYESGWLGALLLLFKVAVIVPTIGAFAGYFEQRGGEEAAREEAVAAEV